MLVLTVLWTLATPLFAAPDEPAHVLKAVATARGELLARPVPGDPAAVMDVVVPAGYATVGQVPSCFYKSRDEPAGCAKDPVYRGGGGQDPDLRRALPSFLLPPCGLAEPAHRVSRPGRVCNAVGVRRRLFGLREPGAGARPDGQTEGPAPFDRARDRSHTSSSLPCVRRQPRRPRH